MRTKIFLVIALFGLATLCQAQQYPKWEKWGWMMGAWKGEGSGKPGEGSGSFAFSFDLNGEVIVRRAHTDFPAAQGKPAATHDDLMVIYSDPTGGAPKAIYFDNEGHTINYSITFPDNSIVFTSEKIGNAPAFRLTYTLIDKVTMNTAFDMSQDGKTFVTYIEGKSKRAK